MIVGVRVSDTNHPRQTLRTQLRAAHDILTKPLRTHPLVRHIFYIVEVPSDSPSPDRAVNVLSVIRPEFRSYRAAWETGVPKGVSRPA